MLELETSVQGEAGWEVLLERGDEDVALLDWVVVYDRDGHVARLAKKGLGELRWVPKQSLWVRVVIRGHARWHKDF